jgi:hypothetical protein
MSDRLTLAVKARALIGEDDPNTVRAGLREIAEALEATGKMPRAAINDLRQLVNQPFVDALRDKLLLAAINDSRFDTILSTVLEMLCCCIVEGWLSSGEAAAEPNYPGPDRTVVARDLGNDLPHEVERWAQEHGRTGCLLALEPDARGWEILDREFSEDFEDDDGDMVES